MRSLKQDILAVSTSNLIVLISSFINGFFLPYILSIDDYANYKTFALYATFIGFMHLGFVDGINIKYGGKNESNIDKYEIKYYHDFFIKFQLIAVFCVLIVGIIIQDLIVILISLAILPVNLQSFFLFYYQALGSFKPYTRAVVLAPLITIIITLSLIFLGFNQYYFFVVANISGYFFSVLYLELTIKRSLKSISIISENGRKKKYDKKSIFLSGFFILIGNILFALYFDMGRWITKFYFDNIDFANYSLGLSLIGFVLIFINALNKTFYPHMHNNYNKEIFEKYRNALYIIGSFSLIGYFFIDEIVLRFLPKYVESLPITAILITSIPGMLIVKSIYVNSYKIFKEEKLFMIHAFLYLIVSILIFTFFMIFFENLIGIAISTVLSIYVWSFFPVYQKYFNLKSTLIEIIFLLIVFAIFLIILKTNQNNFFKSISFLLSVTLINFLFFRKQIKIYFNIK